MFTVKNLSACAPLSSLLAAARGPRRPARTGARRCQPSLDGLETRLVLSAVSPTPPAPHAGPTTTNSGPSNGSGGQGSTTDYPFTSSNPLTSVAFNESDVLSAANLDAANGTFDVWYSDEHALALGVSQVTVKTSSGTTTTNYPVAPLTSDPGSVVNPAIGTTASSGDQAGTDTSGRPLAPSLFITDITNDPTSRSGDWQYGGAAYAPSAVFGSWKPFTSTVNETGKTPGVTLTAANDPAKNGWNLGPGADAAPPGLKNEGYGAEIQWNLNALYQQGLLIPGHDYRFYVMVHDGDQNKSGGDAGQASFDYRYPGPGANYAAQPASLLGYVTGPKSIPLSGVTVTLTGTDNQGNAVNLTAITNSQGYYAFNNLAPGTYTVLQPQPSGYTINTTTPGTVGGNTDGVVDGSGNIAQITLGNGDQGVNYEFSDFYVPA